MKVLLVAAVVALIHGSYGKYVFLSLMDCNFLKSCNFIAAIGLIYKSFSLQIYSYSCCGVFVFMYVPVCLLACLFLSPLEKTLYFLFCHNDGFPLVVT